MILVRYREVYEHQTHGRDKTPAEPLPEDAGKPEAEKQKEAANHDNPPEEQQGSETTNESGGRNLIVIICLAALALALIPGLVFAWKKRHGQTGLCHI